MDELRDRLNTDDHQLWLLIGLCVAVVLTIEAVEEAVVGAWPHQRRLTRMGAGEQRAHPVWAVAALLLIPGAVLAVLNVGMMVWKDVPENDQMVTGGTLLAIGWVTFLLASIDRLRLRGLLGRAGPALPAALVVVLAAATALLLASFLEIRPTMDTVRDAIPYLGEDE
jgi:hypothetical protein